MQLSRVSFSVSSYTCDEEDSARVHKENEFNVCASCNKHLRVCRVFACMHVRCASACTHVRCASLVAKEGEIRVLQNGGPPSEKRVSEEGRGGPVDRSHEALSSENSPPHEESSMLVSRDSC